MGSTLKRASLPKLRTMKPGKYKGAVKIDEVHVDIPILNPVPVDVDVPTYVEKVFKVPVIKEIVKEVPVEKVKIHETVRTVEVPRYVDRDVEVPKGIDKLVESLVDTIVKKGMEVLEERLTKVLDKRLKTLEVPRIVHKDKVTVNETEVLIERPKFVDREVERPLFKDVVVDRAVFHDIRVDVLHPRYHNMEILKKGDDSVLLREVDPSTGEVVPNGHTARIRPKDTKGGA